MSTRQAVDFALKSLILATAIMSFSTCGFVRPVMPLSTSCDGRSTQKTPTVIRLGALALFLRAFFFGRIGKRRYIFSRFAISFVMAACAVALSHLHAWAGSATHFDVTPTFMLAGTQATFTITALDSSNNIDPAPRTVIVEYPQDLPGTFQPTSVDLTFGTGAFLGTLKVGNHLIILVDKDNPNFTTFILLTGSSSTPKRLAR